MHGMAKMKTNGKQAARKGAKEAFARPALAAACKANGGWEHAAKVIYLKGVDVTGSYLRFLARGERDPAEGTAREIAKAFGIKIADVR